MYWIKPAAWEGLAVLCACIGVCVFVCVFVCLGWALGCRGSWPREPVSVGVRLEAAPGCEPRAQPPDPTCHPDCREEQYPCTRLYSIHKPCKQCLNEVCFYR